MAGGGGGGLDFGCSATYPGIVWRGIGYNLGAYTGSLGSSEKSSYSWLAVVAGEIFGGGSSLYTQPCLFMLGYVTTLY